MRPAVAVRLALVLSTFAVSAAVAAPPATDDATAAWQEALAAARADLDAGRFAAAEATLAAQLKPMEAGLRDGDGERRLFARALALLAAARAARGDDEGAMPAWWAAQNLDPALGRRAVAELGPAGRALAGHRLRRAGRVPRGEPRLRRRGGGRRGGGDGYAPPLPLAVPLPPLPPPRWRGAVAIEVVIDAEGRVRRPVVLAAGAPPGVVYRQIEALAGWRFRPATDRGRPVAVTATFEALRDPASPLVDWLRDGALAAIHQRLAAGDWAAARDAALQRAAERLEKGRSQLGVQGALALLAVAQAGAGDEGAALAALRTLESLDGGVFAELPAYGEPGRWLAAQAGVCLGAPSLAAPPAPRCAAFDPAADAGVTPPRPVETPPLSVAPPFAIPPLIDQRLLVRLVVDAEGRVTEARMVAGLQRYAAYPALATVLGWRFEPARRGGRPVAAFYEAGVPLPAEAPPGKLEIWRRQLTEIDARLRAGEGAAVGADVERMAGDVERRLLAGGGDLAAEVLVLRALAAGYGADLSTAVWYWHAAQNLAPELRYRDLTPYGKAGEALAARPLPSLWQADLEARRPADDAPEIVAFDEPVLRSGRPGAQGLVVVEVTVDNRGLARQPRLLAGVGPGRMAAVFEALRGWRFAPAASGDGARRRTVVLRLARRIPYQQLSSRRGFPLLFRSRSRANDDAVEAACLWRSAQLADPAVAFVDLAGLLGSRETERYFVARLQPTLVPRWPTLPTPPRAIGAIEPPQAVDAPPPPPVPEKLLEERSAVVVRALVGRDGRVESARTVGPFGALGNRAVETVCGWRFAAPRRDGAPVRAYHDVRLEFTAE